MQRLGGQVVAGGQQCVPRRAGLVRARQSADASRSGSAPITRARLPASYSSRSRASRVLTATAVVGTDGSGIIASASSIPARRTADTTMPGGEQFTAAHVSLLGPESPVLSTVAPARDARRATRRGRAAESRRHPRPGGAAPGPTAAGGRSPAERGSRPNSRSGQPRQQGASRGSRGKPDRGADFPVRAHRAGPVPSATTRRRSSRLQSSEPAVPEMTRRIRKNPWRIRIQLLPGTVGYSHCVALRADIVMAYGVG